MTRLRPLAVALAGLVIGIGATSCTSDTAGGGSGTITSKAASSASSSASRAASSTAASSSSASPAPTSAAPITDCTGTQIKVTAVAPPGGGAAGHIGVVLLFTNTSTLTCTMTGYPGVDGLDSAGRRIASADRTLNGMIGFCGCTKPASVTLVPGTVVSAVAEGVADGSGTCQPFDLLLVTPPNTSTSTQVTMSPYRCGFTVHPVVAGQAGQSGTPS